MIGMDRVGGQGDSALTIQISQAGWTDVTYLSIMCSPDSGTSSSSRLHRVVLEMCEYPPHTIRTTVGFVVCRARKIPFTLASFSTGGQPVLKPGLLHTK